MPKPTKKHSIEDDTAIMPWVVGETVVQQAAHLVKGPLGEDLYERREEIGEILAKDAERIYTNNPTFRKKIKAAGNKGRDTLYVFMEHWLASHLKKNMRRTYEKLPYGYGWTYSPTVHGMR